MTQSQNTEQVPHFDSYIVLRKFQKQSFRNRRLNRHCEHVIRNGEPITLTKEQREKFTQMICDIPENPVSRRVFFGMAFYVGILGLIPVFIFAVATGLGRSQIDQGITSLFYAIGVIMLVLVIAGFVGLCMLITKRNKKRTERFLAEAHDKIMRGDFQAYAYRIEEIFRINLYDEGEGTIFYWYRVGNVAFELMNSTFRYRYGSHDEKMVFKDPKRLEEHERNHAVGGYIIGILIHLDGQECFYGM